MESTDSNRQSKSSGSNSSIDSKINIAEIYELVKRFDERFEARSERPIHFNPKPVSREMLNDDFTPKVFYHGTNSDFTIFDKKAMGSATDYGIYGRG